ncbi:22017_t:CDS:2 [Cetraspora pellucida]|uniref:22017_t:CDS:1 n=1 Tax=Cetraspora pellucida TaxID=1433469 RepID=A0A9N9HL80_9GLOM|nr:22017_t:CDS:2 [Cetraspora pellucida]
MPDDVIITPPPYNNNNNLNFEGGKALLDSLSKNTTLLALILSGNQLAFKGENQLTEDGFFPYIFPCYELCCNKDCLKEELARAGNRVINEIFCPIHILPLPSHYLENFNIADII